MVLSTQKLILARLEEEIDANNTQNLEEIFKLMSFSKGRLQVLREFLVDKIKRSLDLLISLDPNKQPKDTVVIETILKYKNKMEKFLKSTKPKNYS